MNRLHTSLRSVPPHTTLGHAKALARAAGIVAVRDITGLDCLGIPIFISERARPGATAYAFGKGCLAIESEVGAYMEAIESYFAEPGAGRVETRWGTVRELSGRHAIFDLAPKLNHRAEADAPLLLARAQDVSSGAEAWLPAELVFHPAPDVGTALFGASGNGLASGNSVLEASLHALFELIERDIWSIEFVRERAVRVAPDSLPAEVRTIIGTAERNGLGLAVRHVPNDYGMPFFAAFLFDPCNPRQRTLNGGWGCHLGAEVALLRAVTEAAQSRAAFLHGGRQPPAWDDPRPEEDCIREQIVMLSRAAPAIRFADIAAPAAGDRLEGQWDATVHCLRRVVDSPIYRVVYTPPESPLQVVRLIVPRLEHFSATTLRVGPRLQAELEARAAAGTRQETYRSA